MTGIRRQPNHPPLQHHQRRRDRSHIPQQSPLHANHRRGEELSFLRQQRGCSGGVARRSEKSACEEEGEEEWDVMMWMNGWCYVLGSVYMRYDAKYPKVFFILSTNIFGDLQCAIGCESMRYVCNGAVDAYGLERCTFGRYPTALDD